MFGRILHDQERRLVIGDVIVPPPAGPIADRQAVEQLVATEQRLPQAQQIAFAGKRDAEFLAHQARAAVAADEIGGADFLRFAAGRLHTRGDASVILRSDRNSQPYRTVIAGMVSAMDFNSGSSVYCEIS